jgi:formate hydrogenlyase subunit 6/NADH:ubiquinone oxidoreductase subunit I
MSEAQETPTQAAAPAPTPAARPKGTSRAAPRPAEGYFASIKRAAWSILEGMAVTFSYLRRPPITVQYPDRTPQPVTEMLPERYRGLLEVDVLTCTGCQACERACPINVIRIELGKEGKIRYLTRFDIDLGKCMYCGFCVEACPVDAQAPGDKEITHCIRFTREFEGSRAEFWALTYRYIQPGDKVVVAKTKKGQVAPTAPRGQLAREARLRASESNPALCARGRDKLRATAAVSRGPADIEVEP